MRSRRPAEGPLPNPPVPRGGGGGGSGSSKAFQLKSRLLSPLTSTRLPPEPGLPDSYGFDYPSVSIFLPCCQPPKSWLLWPFVPWEQIILQTNISLVLTARPSTVTVGNVPDTVLALQSLVCFCTSDLASCLSFSPKRP